MSDPPLIFVVGPTASGKSGLALELARCFPVELISMDSAQIYRGMDIGTAKPSRAVRSQVPHHLIDILDPAQRYSAAAFATDARLCIADIRQRGRIPLLVGGTFLYMRALLRGLHALPAADAALRQALQQEAQRDGWPALHQRLATRDPQAAARIHPHDAQRIGRALEIIEQTRCAPSELTAAPPPAPWRGPVLRLALVPNDRAALRRRIATRFHGMLEEGLLDEIRALFARPDLNPELPSMRSVGYRQLWSHLAGEIGQEEAVQRAIIATGQYAKRQLTWLRSEAGLQALPQAPAEAVIAAQDTVHSFLVAHGA